MFKEKKDCIDCFIHSEYSYSGCDWMSGETWSVDLREQLEYERKIKLDKKKRCWAVLIKYAVFTFFDLTVFNPKKCNYCLIICIYNLFPINLSF